MTKRVLACGLALATISACSSSGVRKPVSNHLGIPLQVPSVGTSGVITGRFLAVGGPYGATPSPQRGRIVVLRKGRVVMTVQVAQDGYYTFGILPGHYTLAGYTPQYHVNGKQGRCSAPHPVTVRVGHTTRVGVYCQRS